MGEKEINAHCKLQCAFISFSPFYFKVIAICNAFAVKKRETLVFVSISLLHITRVKANFLIVLLQGRHVLPCFRELSLLHSLADIPVDESSLGIHQIKLMIQPALHKYILVVFYTMCNAHIVHGRTLPKPLQWRWCWRACKQPSAPWPSLLQGSPWEAGN